MEIIAILRTNRKEVLEL